MLALGVAAQTSSAAFVPGVAFLIPALQSGGMSLAGAGALVAAPTVGVTLALIAWGAVTDRWGERLVLGSGLIATGLLVALAATVAGRASHLVLGVLLLLGGVTAASTNAASGRVVVGWFPPHRRGFVMGIRQMAQPLGVGIGALLLPGLAARHGVGVALLLPAALALVVGVACALVIVDPPRPARQQAPAALTASPYGADRRLLRIHSVSVLLVVPQFVVWTYALVWLISQRHLSATAAGVVVTIAQLAGAAGRVGVGALSDRVGSRMRPLRWVAVSAAVAMGLLAATAALDWWVSILVLVLATAVTVADNGLAFTAVAEIGGPFWSGRALGVQNTAQFLAAAAVPPVMGALIATIGYPFTFLLTAAFPVAAIPLVPADAAGQEEPTR